MVEGLWIEFKIESEKIKALIAASAADAESRRVATDYHRQMVEYMFPSERSVMDTIERNAETIHNEQQRELVVVTDVDSALSGRTYDTLLHAWTRPSQTEGAEEDQQAPGHRKSLHSPRDKRRARRTTSSKGG